MPSRYEGLPIAAIEAVGTGLPCVFTDIPPLRELHAPAVTWTDVNNIGQLAEALQTISANCPQASESATLEFRSWFGIGRTAMAYRNYYLASEVVPA